MKCPQCGYSTSMRDMFAYHLRTVHALTAEAINRILADAGSCATNIDAPEPVAIKRQDAVPGLWACQNNLRRAVTYLTAFGEETDATTRAAMLHDAIANVSYAVSALLGVVMLQERAGTVSATVPDEKGDAPDPILASVMAMSDEEIAAEIRAAGIDFGAFCKRLDDAIATARQRATVKEDENA